MKRLLPLLPVLAVLTCVVRASPEEWLEVRSKHFTVLSDSSEKQAHRILNQFESMRWLFHTLFPKANVDPSAPVIILAARNKKVFQTFAPASYLAKGQLNLSGYFLQTADRNYVLLRLDANQENHPYASVYHEYTHLHFSTSGELLPLWLSEGLAEFFQNSDIRDKKVLLGEPSADDLFYLRQQRLIPLRELFGIDQRSPYYHEEHKGSIFYAESWALTHYLQVTNRQRGVNQINDYISRIDCHEDPVQAAEEAFGDLEQLQSALEAYIRASSYKQFVMTRTVAPIEESYAVTALTPVQTDAVRADVLANVQREKEARELIEAVLKADPKNAQACETMGALEFRRGDAGGAREWYRKAVQFDSKSYLAHYYFAAMSLDDPRTVPNDLIESSLRTAIQLNPSFAPAYSRLASYYASQHRNPEDTLKLSLQAVRLDPGTLYYRLNASGILTTMGRYADAASMLRSAMNVSRTPQEQTMVQGRIAELERLREQTEQVHSLRETKTEHTNEKTQTVSEQITVVDATPKHPADAKGPKHTVFGVIRSVSCSYPETIEFQLQSATKTFSVYNNKFSSIDLTLFRFIPSKPVNPCTDFEGMKARVQYAESLDKTVDGKVFAIELRK